MPQTTIRKILFLGGSYAITLPVGYIKYYNLKAGDNVKVITGNKNITITPIKEGWSFLTFNYKDYHDFCRSTGMHGQEAIDFLLNKLNKLREGKVSQDGGKQQN